MPGGKSVMRYRGYAGSYLEVDLTRGEVEVCETPEALVEGYLGGNGVGTRLLWDRVPPEADPLGEQNLLVVATGPLCGTLVPNGGRVEFVAKSPLTGIYGDSNSGGFLGPELKFAGFDFVVISGRSPEPVYLWITDGRAEIRSARHLWGKDCLETEFELQRELGPEVKVASVGPAGERLVRFACISVSYQRQAGRCGLGAVMGAKMLKALAVRGHGAVAVADPWRFRDYCLALHRRIREDPMYPSVSRYGTPGIVGLMNEIGRFPTRNFQAGSFERAEDLGADVLRSRHLVRDIACFGCPVGCDKVYEIRRGPGPGVRTRSFEYETLSSLGSGVGVADLEAVARGNELCDRLGMDSISAGRVISFLIELYEKGIVSRSDVDGLDLTWGNAAAVVTLLERIARREGIGDLLAEGVRRAAASIGRGAEQYAMHVKGMEIPGQDGRAQQSMGLAHITSTRGADHLKAFPTLDETGVPSQAVRRYGEQYLPEIVDPQSTRYKPWLVKDGEDFAAVVDSCGNCKSGGTFVLAQIYWPEMAEALRLAVGWDMGEDELKRTGERIYNLQRCYNALHGITREDDCLPRRFIEEPSPSGRARGCVAHAHEMLEEYYRLRGWDPVLGWPRPEKLRELGLQDVAERLYGGEGTR